MRKLIILLILMSSGALNLKAPELAKEIKEDYASQALEIIRYEQKLYHYKNSEFSIDNLRGYLKLKKIDNADEIISQAILETGWFSSRLFKQGNNLFGMKVSRVRKNTSNGSLYGHARYKSWIDSVDDYILWLEYWTNLGYDNDNHYAFLNQIGYAEDINYNNKLRWIKKRLA